MCSLTMCSAFALALAFGNGRPANTPSNSVVISKGISSSDNGVSVPESISKGRMCSAVGDVSSFSGTPPPPWMLSTFGGDWGRGSETSGKCCSRIRVIAARCEPASTARTEFLDHLVAVDRTRKPVTLSSVGPPPAPKQITWIAGSLLCPDDLRTSLCASLSFIPSAPVLPLFKATLGRCSQPLSRGCRTLLPGKKQCYLSHTRCSPHSQYVDPTFAMM